jgi:bifunctional non-homologous end joining protein LigD
MTELLPEFATIGALDGELIAFGRDRLPSFERIRRRMLQRDRSVPFALVLFDVLALDGEPVDRLPYLERRAILESLSFVRACKSVRASTTGRRSGALFASFASRES